MTKRRDERKMCISAPIVLVKTCVSLLSFHSTQKRFQMCKCLSTSSVRCQSPQRDDTLFSRIENKRDYTKVIFTRKPDSHDENRECGARKNEHNCAYQHSNKKHGTQHTAKSEGSKSGAYITRQDRIIAASAFSSNL